MGKITDIAELNSVLGQAPGVEALLAAPAGSGANSGTYSRAGFRMAPLEAEFLREMTAEDVILSATTVRNSKQAPLTKLRTIHHKVALLLAQGVKPVVISEVTGITQSRISVLQADPTFIELLQHYQQEEKEFQIDVRERIRDITITSLEVLQERLDETPEAFDSKDLIKLVETSADRAGFAPVTRKESVSVTLGAADIAEIKQSGNLSNVVQRNTRTLLGEYRVETTVESRTEETHGGES